MRKKDVCKQNEFCTNCPMRKDCSTRILFYSEEEYQKHMKNVDNAAKLICFSLFQNTSDVQTFADSCKAALDKKRQRELELHPTYSPD